MTTTEIKALPSYKSMRRITWMVWCASLLVSLSTGYLSLLGCIAGCNLLINNYVYLPLMLLNPFILQWLIRSAYFSMMTIEESAPRKRVAFFLQAILLIFAAIVVSTALIGLYLSYSSRLFESDHIFYAVASIVGFAYPVTTYIVGLFVLIGKAIDSLFGAQRGTQTVFWLKGIVILFMVAGVISFALLAKQRQNEYRQTDIGGSYSKDAHAIYWDYHQKLSADPATFQADPTSENLGRDAQHVYLLGDPIAGADPATFHLFENSDYGKDAQRVYYANAQIEGADLATFQVLPAPPTTGYSQYAIDRSHVFAYGKILDGALPGDITFLSRQPQFAVNEENIGDIVSSNGLIFWNGERLEGADASSFVLMDNSRYAKDVHSVYYYGRTLSGADPDTLSVSKKNNACAKDHSHTYAAGEIDRPDGVYSWMECSSAF